MGNVSSPATVERWWKGQSKYIVRTYPVLTKPVRTWQTDLFDMDNKITVDMHFDEVYLAKEFAFELVHNLLHKPPALKPSSFDVRQLLVAYEQQLCRFLGQADLSKTCREALEISLDITRDAISDEVWLE